MFLFGFLLLLLLLLFLGAAALLYCYEGQFVDTLTY